MNLYEAAQTPEHIAHREAVARLFEAWLKALQKPNPPDEP